MERLEQYLRFRVPELCSQYNKFPEQNPCISVDPATKLYFILLPQYAFLSDINKLKIDAFRAAFDEDFDIAEQLCIRAMAAASGQDMEVWELNNKIQQRKLEKLRHQFRSQPNNPQSYSDVTEDASTQSESFSEDTASTSNKEVMQELELLLKYFFGSQTEEKSSPSVDEATPANATSPAEQTHSQEGSRSATRMNGSASNKVKTQLETTILWNWLTGGLVFYGFCGVALGKLSAPFWAWLIALACTAFFALAMALVGSLIVALGVGALVVAVAGTWALAATWALAGAWALARASEELLERFSRPFIIFISMAIAGLGLGLGWLMHWVYLLLKA